MRTAKRQNVLCRAACHYVCWLFGLFLACELPSLLPSCAPHNQLFNACMHIYISITIRYITDRFYHKIMHLFHKCTFTWFIQYFTSYHWHNTCFISTVQKIRVKFKIGPTSSRQLMIDRSVVFIDVNKRAYIYSNISNQYSFWRLKGPLRSRVTPAVHRPPLLRTDPSSWRRIAQSSSTPSPAAPAPHQAQDCWDDDHQVK